MLSIKKSVIPDEGLLNKYVDKDTYTDCYMTDISGKVTFEEYVFAFYTGFIFKIERLILKIAVSRPSTDEQIKQLVAGEIDTFAAWDVEARGENQLLLCDLNDRTRSWLMLVSNSGDHGVCTRLYFGSAVLPVANPSTGELSLGWVYRALLGFHKLYSIVLLISARLRLERLYVKDR